MREERGCKGKHKSKVAGGMQEDWLYFLKKKSIGSTYVLSYSVNRRCTMDDEKKVNRMLWPQMSLCTHKEDSRLRIVKKWNTKPNATLTIFDSYLFTPVKITVTNIISKIVGLFSLKIQQFIYWLLFFISLLLLYLY